MIACRIVDARKLENEKRIQLFSKLTRLVVTESLLDLLARVHAERAVAHDGLVDRLAREQEGLGGALGLEAERLAYLYRSSILSSVLTLGYHSGSRSRLYRTLISPPNPRWQALDEIYQIYIPSHLSGLVTNVGKFFAIFQKHSPKFAIFVAIIART